MSRLALTAIAAAFALVALAPAHEAAARVFTPGNTEVSSPIDQVATAQKKKSKKKTAAKKKKKATQA
jgi:hypothetical protein